MRFRRDAEDAQRVGTRFKGNVEIRVRFGLTERSILFLRKLHGADPFGDETTMPVLSALGIRDSDVCATVFRRTTIYFVLNIEPNSPFRNKWQFHMHSGSALISNYVLELSK